MAVSGAGRRTLLLLLAAAALVIASVAAVHRAPSWTAPQRSAAAPVVTVQTVVSGLGQITAITNAGDDRLFVTVQNGRVFIVSGGQALPTPFLDVSSLVSCCGERGLLSVAFHP